MTSYLLEHLQLSRYGDCFGLRQCIDPYKLLQEISEYDNKWTIVAKSQPTNERFYLDITSPDGSIGHGTVSDYNKINNVNLSPDKFNTLTDIYHSSSELRNCLDGIGELGRSAILKMNKGSYFAPHRDMHSVDYNLFRIIVPLCNTEYPHSCLTLEDKIVTLKEGRLYYFNAAKAHSLFYMGTQPSYWILLNVVVNKHNLDYVENQLLLQ